MLALMCLLVIKIYSRDNNFVLVFENIMSLFSYLKMFSYESVPLYENSTIFFPTGTLKSRLGF